jgi:hypothetical protein
MKSVQRANKKCKEPKYVGISRAVSGRGWMFNNQREQLLVSSEIKEDSSPYIKPRMGDKIKFTPGVAVFCKRSEESYYISDDVEFLHIQ